MNIMYSILLILVLILNCGNASSLKKKDKEIPKDAKKGSYSIIHKADYGITKAKYLWSESEESKGKYYLKYENYYLTNKANVTLSYHSNGLPHSKIQRVTKIGTILTGEGGDISSGKREYSYGRITYYYFNGKVKRQVCAFPNVNSTQEDLPTFLDMSYEPNFNDFLCGLETSFNEDGSVKETINHPRKCTMGCGEFTPYLDEGEKYKVDAEEIKVHKEPNAKSEVIATLKKGTVFKIKEDTKKIEEIGENIAPWGKIGYGFMNMSSGYIYGSESFVSGPYN